MSTSSFSFILKYFRVKASRCSLSGSTPAALPQGLRLIHMLEQACIVHGMICAGKKLSHGFCLLFFIFLPPLQFFE